MPLDNQKPTPTQGRRPLLILAVATAVAILIVLHVTGVLGPAAG